MNGVHFCHDLLVETHVIRDTKFSRLSARWQEISKLFETCSIDRGSTLVHRHILKVNWFSFLLAGRSRQIQKIAKISLPILEISLVQRIILGTDFNSMVTFKVL